MSWCHARESSYTPCVKWHYTPCVRWHFLALVSDAEIPVGYARKYGLRHDKTNNVTVHPVKTQISLGICPVWSESLLSAWKKLGSLATHWVHSEDSDQTGRMPRLVWVFSGCTLILLVLSCRGSYVYQIWILYLLQFVSNELKCQGCCYCKFWKINWNG